MGCFSLLTVHTRRISQFCLQKIIFYWLKSDGFLNGIFSAGSRFYPNELTGLRVQNMCVLPQIKVIILPWLWQKRWHGIRVMLQSNIESLDCCQHLVDGNRFDTWSRGISPPGTMPAAAKAGVIVRGNGRYPYSFHSGRIRDKQSPMPPAGDDDRRNPQHSTGVGKRSIIGNQ